MIPVNEPLIGERECEYVVECLKTGWISSAGRFIDEFERSWADYCGMPYGVAVSNGTVALQLSVQCVGVGAGDEVIMPTFTIISCAHAVVLAGGIPVLVDCDPDTWTMDVGAIEERITRRTKAIMAVHIYGHPVDMDPVRAVADRYGLLVIEDAAEAHGAEYLSRRNAEPKWERCGGLADVSVFSFYANKLVTTGEGGMVLARDPKHAKLARSLRNLCFRPERRFYHTELGYNFRLTNVQAAIGVAQVERISSIVDHKRWMGKAYTEGLCGLSMLQLPEERPWARQVYWMYGIVLDEATGMDAAEFASRLSAEGIETRPFFVGMHAQPVFQQQGMFRGEQYPVADRITRQGLYLPSGMTLTAQQLADVVGAVRRLLTD